MTDYSKKTTGRTPRPRSKRLRELGSVAPSSGALDSTLLDRLVALESLFEIVDEAVHVKNGRGLYSDSFISAGGIGEPGAGGGTSADNPYYDNAIVATMSDGSVVRTELTNGKVPDWWTNNVLGLSTAAKREKLVKVEIGKNCEQIGDYAFYGCTNLKSIYCYASVQPDPLTGSVSAFAQLESTNGVLHYPVGSDYSLWLTASGIANRETLGDWNWTGRDDAVTPTGEPTGGDPSNPGASSIAGLSDVAVKDLAAGDVLYFNGTKWVNYASSNLGGGTRGLSDLSDVSASSPSSGDVLYFNGTKWVNYPSSGLGTDTSGDSSGYVLPLANDGTRGGIQLGFISSGPDVAVKVADEKAYVTVPDMYIGTTKMQLSPQAQALTGITNLTASGTVRADIGNFTGALTAAAIKTTGTLRIGDAILTYADDVLTLRKADGSICSFIASGNIAAGQ